MGRIIEDLPGANPVDNSDLFEPWPRGACDGQDVGPKGNQGTEELLRYIRHGKAKAREICNENCSPHSVSQGWYIEEDDQHRWSSSRKCKDNAMIACSNPLNEDGLCPITEQALVGALLGSSLLGPGRRSLRPRSCYPESLAC